LLEPHAASLHVLDGPLALEVVPAVERDKGTALSAIAAPRRRGTADRAVCRRFRQRRAGAGGWRRNSGGIALGIGPEPPAEAAYRLPDPAALAALLATLADTLTTAAHAKT
jgi:hypothetical protein